jgi:hypothetical protein
LSSPAITLLEQLRDNADCDFAWLIRAEVEADWAVERFAIGFRDAGCGKFFDEHRSLRFAADDAKEGELPVFAEDFFEDRAVGGVAHGHADDEGVGGKLRDKRARFAAVQLP